jgi:hypothetical protein
MTLDELKTALAHDGDLRRLLGGLMASIITNPAYRDPLAALVRQALADAGVLTAGNVHESAGLYARVSETVGQELEARGLHKPPTP